MNDNEQIKVTPPKEETNLLVTKTVTCEDLTDSSVLSVQQRVNPCLTLENTITEDQFDISVTDSNPVPSQFQGSEGGQNVALGTGPYTVTEAAAQSVQTDIDTLKQQLGVNIAGPTPSFAGDCTPPFQGSFSATGTIAEGESQTCNIENSFTISLLTCVECFTEKLSPTTLALVIATIDNYAAETGVVIDLTTDCEIVVSNSDLINLISDILTDEEETIINACLQAIGINPPF